MKYTNVESDARGFTVTWDNQFSAEVPYIWLRDNDPGELHPHTQERVFDLTSVALDINPDSFQHDESQLSVYWPQKDDVSNYSADWLYAHCPGRTRTDAAAVQQALWSAESMPDIPRFSMQECLANPDALGAALRTLKRDGIMVIDEMDDAIDASKRFIDAIGFVRQTNFGSMFEVINVPDPINLAYTALALPLHTDVPCQEVIPGYQFLHCYKNSATGGESVFADGFQICSDLRDEAPEDFEILRSVAIPWRFHDEESDIRERRAILGCNPDGTFEYFAINAHNVDVPDMDADTLVAFYGAYQRLMIRVRDPKYVVHYALSAGEMVAFDNKRVLHGRTSFDAQSGERHLRGYYIERNEIDSRIRVLARQQN